MINSQKRGGINMDYLNELNPEQYEAAKIDGASKWQEIWHIR